MTFTMWNKDPFEAFLLAKKKKKPDAIKIYLKKRQSSAKNKLKY